jgi:hypothetical protein
MPKKPVEKPAEKAPKPVKVIKKAKPEVEAVPKAPKVAFQPILGEKYQHDGNIIAFTSLAPLQATVYRTQGSVVTTNNYPMDSLEDVQPISKEEVYRRLY